MVLIAYSFEGAGGSNAADGDAPPQMTEAAVDKSAGSDLWESGFKETTFEEGHRAHRRLERHRPEAASKGR